MWIFADSGGLAKQYPIGLSMHPLSVHSSKVIVQILFLPQTKAQFRVGARAPAILLIESVSPDFHLSRLISPLRYRHVEVVARVAFGCLGATSTARVRPRDPQASPSLEEVQR